VSDPDARGAAEAPPTAQARANGVPVASTSHVAPSVVSFGLHQPRILGRAAPLQLLDRWSTAGNGWKPSRLDQPGADGQPGSAGRPSAAHGLCRAISIATAQGGTRPFPRGHPGGQACSARSVDQCRLAGLAGSHEGVVVFHGDTFMVFLPLLTILLIVVGERVYRLGHELAPQAARLHPTGERQANLEWFFLDLASCRCQVSPTQPARYQDNWLPGSPYTPCLLLKQPLWRNPRDGALLQAEGKAVELVPQPSLPGLSR